MTDFTAKAPVHPDRTHELHDQEQMPKEPQVSRPEQGRRFSILIVGTILAVAFTALGVDILDGWDARRDPLVPGAATFAALGGIAAAYLFIRGRGQEFGIGIMLIILSGSLLFFSHLRGNYVDGSDALRDVFTVGAGILFTVAMVFFAIAWLVIELKSRNAPPPPEM
jgi:4-amino-4-deoxy-L-arabinose transferase-like glycosyltransferase